MSNEKIIAPAPATSIDFSDQVWPINPSFDQVPSTGQGNPASEPTSSLAPSGTTDEPKPTEPFTFTAPIQEANQEPTVEENASMIRQAFNRIISKAVEATDLAKRVGDLETQLQGLVKELSDHKEALNRERISHGDTRKQLQEVQTQLAQRESTVSDLVKERDVVVNELNTARSNCEFLTSERDSWATLASDVEHDRDEERHRNHILEERCNTMTQRVNALKEAFGALHSL